MKNKTNKNDKPAPFPNGMDLPDGHHCKPVPGANGFTKYGSAFHLSPGMTDSWRRIESESEGLSAFVHAQNIFVLHQEQRIAAERRRFWSNVFETINVPREILATHNVFMIDDGVVRVEPKKPKQSENKRLNEEIELDQAGAGADK